MVRLSLRVISALVLLLVAWVIAARVAEPSVRPVLYAARPTAPPTTAILATTSVPAITVPVDAAPSTALAPTTTVPPSTALAPTTTVPPSATLALTTTVPPTTTVPIDEIAVLSATYPWGPSQAAITLQYVLGVIADGWYGPATRTAHLAENQSRGLSLDGIPPVPTTTTVAPPETTTTAPASEPAANSTTTTVPPADTTPPIMVDPTFGGMGAQLVAQLLGQPCIADGDLSDCPPEVGLLVTGLVGG